MNSGVEQELGDRWLLGLRGTTLQSVDTQELVTALSFGGRCQLTIKDAAPVKVVSGQGTGKVAVTADGDGTVSMSDVVTPLISQRVLSSVGFKTGALRLVFELGSRLTIASCGCHEAWALTGPSGRTWVCLPGGGLATRPATAS